MLAASVVAGALWDVIGPDGTFLAGAAFTAVALAALPLARRSAAKLSPRENENHTTTVSFFAARVTPV